MSERNLNVQALDLVRTRRKLEGLPKERRALLERKVDAEDSGDEKEIRKVDRELEGLSDEEKLLDLDLKAQEKALDQAIAEAAALEAETLPAQKAEMVEARRKAVGELAESMAAAEKLGVALGYRLFDAVGEKFFPTRKITLPHEEIDPRRLQVKTAYAEALSRAADQPQIAREERELRQLKATIDLRPQIDALVREALAVGRSAPEDPPAQEKNSFSVKSGSAVAKVIQDEEKLEDLVAKKRQVLEDLTAARSGDDKAAKDIPALRARLNEVEADLELCEVRIDKHMQALRALAERFLQDEIGRAPARLKALQKERGVLTRVLACVAVKMSRQGVALGFPQFADANRVLLPREEIQGDFPVDVHEEALRGAFKEATAALTEEVAEIHQAENRLRQKEAELSSPGQFTRKLKTRLLRRAAQALNA